MLDDDVSGQATRVRRWALSSDTGEVLADAVPFLHRRLESVWLLALGPGGRTIARSGEAPDAADRALSDLPASAASIPSPAAWHGIASLSVIALGAGTRLVAGWGAADQHVPASCEADLAVLDLALRHHAATAELADLTERVDNAQRLADMGDYDWVIATDTNRWSDHLFRIYGYEPGTFAPTYEKFLAHVHPDDQERIKRLHEHAYASGEPYQMVERIVRPNGEVRHLSSNGQVVRDESGTPVRMRGTCLDITEQVLAKEAEERSTGMFRALVESSPDAIVVVDADGVVVQANGQAGALLGEPPAGHPVSVVLPELPSGMALGVAARRFDGTPLELDVATVPISPADGLCAVFLHDSAVRVEREQVAARLREVEVRRRQALELNDSVVQGLVTAILAMREGDTEAVSRWLGLTLSAARSMMNEWLTSHEGADLATADLVRSSPSSLGRADEQAAGQAVPSGQAPADPPAAAGDEQVRILVVEDNEDLRVFLRRKLDMVADFDVVGEGADGEEAIARAEELKPDVVMLDLAMPRMDGLTALPLILQAAPAAKVVVLSGFDESTMADRALAAGAHAYLEKGPGMHLEQVVRHVLTQSGARQAG